ncbi:MAG: hypothetical protein ACI4RA_11225 [Kiritimatiellia bacterium]
MKKIIGGNGRVAEDFSYKSYRETHVRGGMNRPYDKQELEEAVRRLKALSTGLEGRRHA